MGEHVLVRRVLVVTEPRVAELAHRLDDRQERFARIKERNAQRIEECARTGKVRVLFNSNPVEITQDSVILDVKGQLQQIPNDFVWIFAGGVPPTDFLKKIGVDFGMRDMVLEASKEAKQAALLKKQLEAYNGLP